ncbi:hypothetical protein, partial [Pseudomonas asiatica]|uniref:hypothetical protein n=1 Tax=Pseudomonas asiatica TaxID=2219225 RepID=UPI003523964E
TYQNHSAIKSFPHTRKMLFLEGYLNRSPSKTQNPDTMAGVCLCRVTLQAGHAVMKTGVYPA